MEREDFLFTIGYQGNSPVVDKQARKDYGKLSTMELAEKGLFKPAFCSALFSENDEEIKAFLDYFNSVSERKYGSAFELKRLFGVFGVPKDTGKVILI